MASRDDFAWEYAIFGGLLITGVFAAAVWLVSSRDTDPTPEQPQDPTADEAVLSEAKSAVELYAAYKQLNLGPELVFGDVRASLKADNDETRIWRVRGRAFPDNAASFRWGALVSESQHGGVVVDEIMVNGRVINRRKAEPEPNPTVLDNRPRN